MPKIGISPSISYGVLSGTPHGSPTGTRSRIYFARTPYGILSVFILVFFRFFFNGNLPRVFGANPFHLDWEKSIVLFLTVSRAKTTKIDARVLSV